MSWARASVAAIGVGLLAYAGYRYAQQGNGGPPTARQYVQARQQQLTPSQQLARSNAMELIRLRGRAAGAQSVDVIVHGTNARGADWANPNSSFAQQVRGARNAVSTSFQWSGSFVEADRQTAGGQLSRFLRDTQNPLIAQGAARTNVIAHSHGGNVLGHALSNNATQIDNAVLLATPSMSQGGNPNVSWSAQGTHRVRNAVLNLSAPDDMVQTTLAQANERIRGHNINADRPFSRPDALTPQFNVTVTQPQGRLGFARDIALGAAHMNIQAGGDHRRTMGAIALAAAAEGARRIQAHSDMHSDRVGGYVSGRLTTLESVHGRNMMMIRRLGNAMAGHTAPVNTHQHLP